MKKLQDIPPAWKNGNMDPSVQWEKDALIAQLEQDGHKTISIDRAVVIIEQCDLDDSYPQGSSEDPLKISVYSDPDAGVYAPLPEELFIHARRYGIMQIFMRRPNANNEMETFRLIPVDANKVNKIASLDEIAQAEMISALIEKNISRFYLERDGNFLKPKADQELENLANEVKENLQRYIGRLRSLIEYKL